AEKVGDEVVAGAAAEVDLFERRVPWAIDVGVVGVHEQVRYAACGIPREGLGVGTATSRGGGCGGAEAVAVVGGGAHVRGGVGVAGEFSGAVVGGVHGCSHSVRCLGAVAVVVIRVVRRHG